MKKRLLTFLMALVMVLALPVSAAADFSGTEQPALPDDAPAPVGKAGDVMLLMDVSSSMRGRFRDEKNAAAELVAAMHETAVSAGRDCWLTVILYSGRAFPAPFYEDGNKQSPPRYRMNIAGDADCDMVISGLQALRSSPGSNLDGALHAAHDLLGQGTNLVVLGSGRLNGHNHESVSQWLEPEMDKKPGFPCYTRSTAKFTDENGSLHTVTDLTARGAWRLQYERPDLNVFTVLFPRGSRRDDMLRFIEPCTNQMVKISTREFMSRYIADSPEHAVVPKSPEDLPSIMSSIARTILAGG